MKEKMPYRDLLVEAKNAQVFVMGLCYDNGCSCGKGAALAPTTIRELSQHLPPFSKDGFDLRDIMLHDCGDKICSGLNQIEEATRPLFDLDQFLIFIGGDHSISIPLQAHFYKRAINRGKIPAIIHIDAHPDICDEYQGNRFSHACPNARIIELGVKPENMTMIGIRGYEAQEVEYFKSHPELKIYTASYLNEEGCCVMLENIVSKYDNNYEVYLSYDIDANDPSYAPGTGTPEAFGLASQTVLKIITTLIQKLNVSVLDIVEVSPPLDCNDMTSWLALKTLYEVFKELIIKRKK